LVQVRKKLGGLIMSSSSATSSGSTITCDETKLRKVVFDVLDSSESAETMSTKELRRLCETKLKLPSAALKVPQNKELFKSIINEYNTRIETTAINRTSRSSIDNNSSSKTNYREKKENE
jgi:hypothetical protein